MGFGTSLVVMRFALLSAKPVNPNRVLLLEYCWVTAQSGNGKAVPR